MRILPFDEILEGMTNNADDSTIDGFLAITKKAARILHTRQDDLYVIVDREYLDTYGLEEIKSPYKNSKLYLSADGNYVIEELRGMYFVYARSEEEAENFHDDLDESYGYKEKEMHDYLSAVRFAKQHDGRITGPKMGENGLKVFKVIYKESLSEDFDYDHNWNEEEYEDRMNDAYDAIYDSYYSDIVDYAIDRVAGRELIEESLTETTDEEALKLISDYLVENNISGLDKLSKPELLDLVSELDLDDIVRSYISGSMDFDDEFRYACIDSYIDYAQIDFDDYMR